MSRQTKTDTLTYQENVVNQNYRDIKASSSAPGANDPKNLRLKMSRLGDRHKVAEDNHDRIAEI